MQPHVRTALGGLVIVVTVAGCAGTTNPSSGITNPPAGTTNPSAGPVASGSSESADPATQRDEGGQVTVVATWTGLAAGLAIDVALDTHTIDLDKLDLADASLRNDRGETLAARPWAAPKGGHHREGILTFDGNAGEFLSGTRWMELVLVGVGDVPERTLRWEVGS